MFLHLFVRCSLERPSPNRPGAIFFLLTDKSRKPSTKYRRQEMDTFNNPVFEGHSESSVGIVNPTYEEEEEDEDITGFRRPAFEKDRPLYDSEA